MLLIEFTRRHRTVLFPESPNHFIPHISRFHSLTENFILGSIHGHFTSVMAGNKLSSASRSFRVWLVGKKKSFHRSSRNNDAVCCHSPVMSHMLVHESLSIQIFLHRLVREFFAMNVFILKLNVVQFISQLCFIGPLHDLPEGASLILKPISSLNVLGKKTP